VQSAARLTVPPPFPRIQGTVANLRRSSAEPEASANGLATPAGGLLMIIGIGHIQPLVALLAGILILLVPRILNYVIAIYLIIVGILGLGILH
jgi:hypothetical protein